MRENKFSIGDTVYHVTPDSGKGVVVEVTYMFSVDKYAYTVATTWNTEYVCSEYELTSHPNF
jgi:heat shock protein HspQ